jgi:branched-chain amino acid aminotransferase
MSLGSKVWMNGVIMNANSAYVSVSDRGFTLGDGLFETMLWTSSRIRFFDEHLARLSQSAVALGFTTPLDVTAIKKGLLALVEDEQGNAAAVRLTLSRGIGPRGLALPETTAPQLIATIAPLADTSAPAHLKTVSVPRLIGAPSTRFKTLSYLDNVMAQHEARFKGGDEAIMLGTNGNVACASCANLVFRYKDANLTPALRDGALPGIVRGRLLAAGLIEEANISPSQLALCEGAALTNALIGVRVVSSIDRRALDTRKTWPQSLRDTIRVG